MKNFVRPIADQFNKVTLRGKLIISFLVVTLFPMAILAAFNYYVTSNLLNDEVNLRLLGRAVAAANTIDDFFETNLTVLQAQAQLFQVVSTMDLPSGSLLDSPVSSEGLPSTEERPSTEMDASHLADELSALAPGPSQLHDTHLVSHIDSLLQALAYRDTNFILSVALLDSQGRNLFDTRASNVGLDESKRNYFQEPLSTREAYVSPINLFNFDENFYFYFSSPILNEADQIIGILRIQYQGAVLQALIDQHKSALSEGDIIILLDESQIQLAHSNDAKQNFRSVNNPAFREAFLQASTASPYLRGEFGSTEVDGLSVAAVTKLRTLPWFIIFASPQSIYLGPLQNLTNTTWLLIMLLVLGSVGFAFGLSQILAGPIIRLTQAAKDVAEGNLLVQVQLETQDEVAQLGQAFNIMTNKLHESMTSLETQIRERTADVLVSLEVGQQATSIRDVHRLLPTITEFIRHRFNLYYVQIYFVEQDQSILQLRTGTGEIGASLLAQKHTLPLDESSIIGRVALGSQSLVISNTIVSDIYTPNELLPETASELSIPLIIEDEVIGVLDMHATQVEFFNMDNIPVFAAMATQLAAAIDSAQQLAVSQEAQRRLQEAVKRYTAEAWDDHLKKHQSGQSLQLSYDLKRAETSRNGHRVDQTDSSRDLNAPVVIQNEPIGQLQVKLPENRPRIENEQALLKAVADKLAQKAENLRLFEQTQQKAAQEQKTREIVDKIRASRDVKTALKIATEQLSKALDVPKVSVDLKIQADKNQEE